MSDTNPVTVILVGSEEAHKVVCEARDANLSIFQAQPGFLGMEVFEEAGGDRIVNQFLWASEEDHLACMQSGDFSECPMNALLQSGKARLDVRVYRRVAGMGPRVAAA